MDNKNNNLGISNLPINKNNKNDNNSLKTYLEKNEITVKNINKVPTNVKIGDIKISQNRVIDQTELFNTQVTEQARLIAEKLYSSIIPGSIFICYNTNINRCWFNLVFHMAFSSTMPNIENNISNADNIILIEKGGNTFNKFPNIKSTCNIITILLNPNDNSVTNLPPLFRTNIINVNLE
jgi:hypothetical protein